MMKGRIGDFELIDRTGDSEVVGRIAPFRMQQRPITRG